MSRFPVVPVLTVALAIGLCTSARARDLTPRYNDPIENYTTIDLEGWTVLVNKRLDKHPDERKEAIEAMRWQLWIIQRIVPAKAVEHMKTVRIWLEYKCVDAAQYHPGRDWLEKNNYNPEKVRCIDVGDVTRHTRRIPGRATMVLGFDEQRIIEAFKKSRDSGAYDQVIRDRHVKVKHYAMTNHKEWFAEISETYLWVNDYYPFNRAELKIVDPQAYALMEDIWGMRTPTEEELRAQENGEADAED